VKNKAGEKIDAKEQKVIDGQKILLLPVGQDYTLLVSNKDYQNNEIELALSNIILFDELVRDIKLDPEKRAIEIFITDKETNNPLEATIELYDERERLFIPEKANDKPGEYKISLREGEKFNVEIRGPRGFAFNHVNIDLNAQRDLTRLNVALQPLMRKVPIRLNNINFESNSADLQESSFVELNRVVQLLIENPDIHTEIMAHTDDIGSDKYNSVLADKRAMSVVEYLIIGGISSNRLVAKGYGETMPVVPNDSEANRALNRRVEMKILDENDSDFFIEERIIQK